MKWRFVPLVVLVALAGLGGAKKARVAIRFHAEANRNDSNVFSTPIQLVVPPRELFVQKIPTISERDIESFFPFRAQDNTMGATFVLNQHGRLALDTVSMDKRGQFIVAVVNARVVSGILVDKRVSDGIITIPNGLADAEIAVMQKQFPIAGAPKKKKR